MKTVHHGIAIAIMVTISQLANAGQMYKWVDEKGNISYQDQPPPKSGKLIEERQLEGISQPAKKPQSGKLVTVYTTEDCELCEFTIMRLKKRDVRFVEKSLKSRTAQQEILAITDQLLAPTLVIDGEAITDVSQSSLDKTLNNAGYSKKPGSEKPDTAN